jgi:hypothetical protein
MQKSKDQRDRPQTREADSEFVDTPDVEGISSRRLANLLLRASPHMIRKHYLTELNRLIVAQERFRESDFEISIKTEDDQVVLEIHYAYAREYYFTAQMELNVAEPVYRPDVTALVFASPGIMFKTERFQDVTTSQLNEHVKTWLTRLINELMSVPVQRQIEEQHQEIQQIIGQLDNIPQEYFSKDEGERVKAKLEDLEARLVKNLGETITDKKELEEKTNVIVQDIAVLKETIQVLNKPGWAKALVTRTFDWAKDPANRKVITTGAKVATEFLLEASKNEHIAPK